MPLPPWAQRQRHLQQSSIHKIGEHSLLRTSSRYSGSASFETLVSQTGDDMSLGEKNSRLSYWSPTDVSPKRRPSILTDGANTPSSKLRSNGATTPRRTVSIGGISYVDGNSYNPSSAVYVPIASRGSIGQRVAEDDESHDLLEFGSIGIPRPVVFENIVKGTGPNVLSCLCLLFPDFVNILLVANLRGPEHLAAIGLGNATLNCSTVIVASGIAAALDRYCSVAFGSRNFSACGVYLGQAQVLVLIYFLIYLTFIGPVLNPTIQNRGSDAFIGEDSFWIYLLHQDPHVMALACEYCSACTRGLPFLFIMETFRRFFANVGRCEEVVKWQILGCLCHCFFLYSFFILPSRGSLGTGSAGELHGLTGLAVANCSTWFATCLMLIIAYVRFGYDYYGSERGMTVKLLPGTTADSRKSISFYRGKESQCDSIKELLRIVNDFEQEKWWSKRGHSMLSSASNKAIESAAGVPPLDSVADTEPSKLSPRVLNRSGAIENTSSGGILAENEKCRGTITGGILAKNETSAMKEASSPSRVSFITDTDNPIHRPSIIDGASNGMGIANLPSMTTNSTIPKTGEIGRRNSEIVARANHVTMARSISNSTTKLPTATIPATSTALLSNCTTSANQYTIPKTVSNGLIHPNNGDNGMATGNLPTASSFNIGVSSMTNAITNEIAAGFTNNTSFRLANPPLVSSASNTTLVAGKAPVIRSFSNGPIRSSSTGPPGGDESPTYHHRAMPGSPRRLSQSRSVVVDGTSSGAEAMASVISRAVSSAANAITAGFNTAAVPSFSASSATAGSSKMNPAGFTPSRPSTFLPVTGYTPFQHQSPVKRPSLGGSSSLSTPLLQQQSSSLLQPQTSSSSSILPAFMSAAAGRISDALPVGGAAPAQQPLNLATGRPATPRGRSSPTTLQNYSTDEGTLAQPIRKASSPQRISAMHMLHQPTSMQSGGIGSTQNAGSILFSTAGHRLSSSHYANATKMTSDGRSNIEDCIVMFKVFDFVDDDMWSGTALISLAQHASICVSNIISEYVFWECLVLLAGMTNPVAQAVCVAAISLYQMVFRTFCGMGAAASCLVGTAIGQKAPRAVRAYRNGFLLSTVNVSLLILAVFLSSKDAIVDFYFPLKEGNPFSTIEHELFGVTLTVAFSATIFFDAVQFVVCSILRACGYAMFNANLFFVQHFVIGLPLAYLLVKHHTVQHAIAHAEFISYMDLDQRYHFYGILNIWLALIVDLAIGTIISFAFLSSVKSREVMKDYFVGTLN